MKVTAPARALVRTKLPRLLIERVSRDKWGSAFRFCHAGVCPKVQTCANLHALFDTITERLLACMRRWAFLRVCPA